MRSDHRGAALALALVLSATLAHAQPATDDPDWKEADAPPPPPALRLQGLLPVDVDRSQLRWGIDPSSLSIGTDGVVRYVVVATGDGTAVNAFYEGLRCGAGEVKVYARRAGDGGWTPAQDGWKSMFDNRSARHSLAIARSGACTGNVPNVSPAQITRDLAANSKGRYIRDSR